MNEQKIKLELKHKVTFKYLTIYVILNPKISFKHIDHEVKQNAIKTIKEEIKCVLIVQQNNKNENKDKSENLTRGNFKAKKN